MNQAQQHYDNLLAAHYQWMVGMPFAEKSDEQAALLIELGLDPGPKDAALDLGCGPGYQSAALCRIGYRRVIALDTCQALLDETKAATAGSPVMPILADLRDFPAATGHAAFDAIVCMGDTLTHLDSREDVWSLLSSAYQALQPGGRLVLTFRDLSSELTGTDRFILVRADDTRIMVCALLYERDHVVVNDLVHARTETGWELHKSSYRKLRLPPAAVVEEARALGFTVETDRSVARMHAIVARK